MMNPPIITRESLIGGRIYNKAEEFNILDNTDFILKVNQNNFNLFKEYCVLFVCIDKDGNKKIKILKNIELFLDLRKNSNKINNLLMNYYQMISEKTTKIEQVKLKPFEYYSVNPVIHDRLFFKNLFNYKQVNDMLSKNEALNDVICQNEGYTTYYNKEVQYKNINLYNNIHDNILLLTFDIEVYSSDEASMPQSSVKEDQIFMLCGTFHRYNSTQLLKSFILTTREIENPDNLFEGHEVLYYYCKSEYKLIEIFIDIIKKTSPEFISGFNDFSFDWVYIKDRINTYYPELLVKLYESVNLITYDNNDRINYDYHTFKKSVAKLSAEQMDEIYYPKSDSIIFVDSRIQLRKIYSTETKSSLNFFLNLLHCGSKDDISVQQMRRAYEKHDKKAMKEIAHYCIVDAFSCQKLLVKKQVINEAMKMGEITGIALEDALNRASGFKIFKLMTKFGLEQTPLYSFLYKKMHPNFDDENTEFCGGFVKSPDYGIKYKTPIFALDYSSLYPSVMRTYNLSHDTFIKDEDLEKFNKNNIPYHTFELTSKKINVIDHLDKPELTGIIPKILEDLLNRRKLIKKGLIAIKTKKELCSKEEAEKLEFEERDLDQKQKAVKVLANSIYGITGARTAGTLYRKEIAECVTMNGRRLIQESIRFAKEKNYEVHYGDSVTFDTPCLVKNIETEEIEYKPICDLYDNDNWITNILDNKEYNTCSKYLVWSNNGWTSIKSVMRHKVKKKIFRINTHIGCVDVTEDHSLYTDENIKISPKDCKIKETKLLHNKYEQEWEFDYEINEELAYLIGWFVADGYTNRKQKKYKKKNGEISIYIDYDWRIDNMNEELLKPLLKIAEKYETNNTFTIYKQKLGTTGYKANAEHIYQIRATKNVKAISLRYRKMCYNSLNEKIVPSVILNSPPNIQKAFYDGFYMGDGYKGINRNCDGFEKSGKSFMAGMHQLINNIDWMASISCRNKQLNVYGICVSKNKKQYKTVNPNVIKKILDVTEKYKDTYVYDFETENHHFHAGIGSIIVSNTDSMYLSLKPDAFIEEESDFKNTKIDIKKLIELKINRTKEHMIQLNKEVNEHLIEFTKYKYLMMSYEEILYPSFYIAKKIYIGLEHINVVNELDIDKNLFVRGFSIIKRNTTELTKDIIKNNLLRKLFSYEAMAKAHLDENFNIEDIIKDEINNVVHNFDRNKYPLEYFIKNDKYSPNKTNIRINKFVENLKEFIETLPSDELKLKYAIPEPADRFDYIYIDKPGAKGLGDLIQYPFYIEDFNAKINYKKYFESHLANEFGSLLCEDTRKGKRFAIKLFEMLNDGYEYDELKSLTIDELLDYKNTIKKARQKEELMVKKVKNTTFKNEVIGLFNNNKKIKVIELFDYFVNDDSNYIFKNIDKLISKMDFREAHSLQSNIYNKYHNNKYKESKANNLLITLLTEQKNKNKKIIQEFINNNYDKVKQLITEHIKKQEIIIDFSNIDKINNIVTLINSDIIEQYINNCMRIYKINEYKKYLQLIRTS